MVSVKVIIEEDVKDFQQAEDNENFDYIVDLKAKSASLTQKGIKKAEDYFTALDEKRENLPVWKGELCVQME